MMGEERVMPTAQEDVEEKQEGVCACPMAMMNTAHTRSCCHLLWRCSEGREAPGDLETTWLHQVFASGQANVLKLLGSPCPPVFPPSSLRMSPVSRRALIFPSQVPWGVRSLQSSLFMRIGWRTHLDQVQRRAMWLVWWCTDAL